MEGGDLWRGGDEGVSYGPRGRPRANGWGCRAGKLQRALESPAPNPLSSALGLNPRILQREAREGWAGQALPRSCREARPLRAC